MTSAASFLGLTDDSDERDKPQPKSSDADLLEDLKQVLRREWANHPRSQQKTIGPSEVGHPCPRRLAGSLLQLDGINPDGDPLPAWLGTAGHAKFEHSVEADNNRIIDAALADQTNPCTWDDRGDGLPVGRWFTERRVEVRPGLSGTCDLFDTWTGTVIDLKFPGTTRHSQYRKNGPSPEYRIQSHLYGRGYRREGFNVKRVAIWFIPCGGMLANSHLWSEPYDDTIVDEALRKIDDITLLLNDLDIENHLERLEFVPKVVHDCMFCPFFTTRAGDQRPGACTGGAK